LKAFTAEELMEYRINQRWRKMRRASDNALSTKTASTYHHVQSLESVLLAHGLLNDAQAWKSHVER